MAGGGGRERGGGEGRGGLATSPPPKPRTAFGNDAVLVEKFITRPRHIEVQIFGDGTEAVHLYERDCSLQRRHQKVIEEAPAPGMTPEMRAAMGKAAVAAARAIGYAGAGTVEFIVDGAGPLSPDRFWFMEMNTRLQVEHPVTEAVTGIDLVEWQLRVAAGEGLPLAQPDIPLTGHAFEARLYAENVPAGFLPATGRLSHLAFPHEARIDTGVRPGDEISPHYDPMIAKITTAGPTRAVALARLARALDHTQVAGLTTNLGFLAALARHPGFRAGEVDTGLIARDLAALIAGQGAGPADWAHAALAATGLLARPGSGFALWVPQTRHLRLAHGDEVQEIAITTHNADHHEITIAGTTLTARCLHGAWEIDGARLPDSHADHGRITLFVRGGLVFDLIDPLEAGAEADTAAGTIEAPMPGLVQAVLCAPGDAVEEGARLVLLEAMKMEHALTAPRAGTIAAVLCAAGDQVDAGAPLIRLEDDADTATAPADEAAP